MGRIAIASSDVGLPADSPEETKANSGAADARGILNRLCGGIGAAVTLIVNSWNTFWYRPADPTVLGVMRLLVGGMLVYTHLIWGLNLPAFVGSAGWNSPEVLALVQQGSIAPTFWWYVNDAWLLPVHCVCIIILIMFWLGMATRVTSILALAITISYSYRAHMSNFGLDQINAILCLYLCIGPSGAVLSIDRWISVWMARRRSKKTSADPSSRPVMPSAAANLAVRLTQIHFCVIYAYAGLSKLQGPAWWSGEAVWLAFANLEYQSTDMTWIAWYPWVSDLMTHSSIVWEISFAALVWVKPVRPVILAIGFMLHAGIGGMMGMWTFALIMIFGHVAFWPKETIQYVASLVPSAERLLGITEDKNSLELSRGREVPQHGAKHRHSLHPALLCVNRNVLQRLQCLHYFLDRGYRCLVTDDTSEAKAVRDATAPNAVVVLGDGIPDDELLEFQDTHYAQPAPQPLFLVLSTTQSERLNGRIAQSESHVLTGQVSLGSLRREIQATLNPATCESVQKSVAEPN